MATATVCVVFLAWAVLASGKPLHRELQLKPTRFGGSPSAENTIKTHQTHLNAYLSFNDKLGIPPVPVTEEELALYATFPARTHSLHLFPRGTDNKSDDTAKTSSNCTYAAAKKKCYTVDEQKFFEQTSLSDMSKSELLDKQCKAYDDTKDCFKSFFEDCLGEAGTILTESQEGLADYVCGEGRDALLSMTSCWNKPSVDFGIKQCENIAAYKVMLLHFTGRPQSDMCPIIQGLRTCVTSVVQHMCGNPTATDFVYDVYTLYYTPVSEVAGCDWGDDDDDDDDDDDAATVSPNKRDIDLSEAVLNELLPLQ